MSDEKQHTYIVYMKMPVGTIRASDSKEAEKILEEVFKERYPDATMEESITTSLKNQGDADE